jgi:hypothetical protein
MWTGLNGAEFSKMGGRTNVHDEERSGRPSVMNDDLAQSVDQKVCERCHFTISKLCVNFHKFHALFSTRLSQAMLLKVLRKMGSVYAQGCAQNVENGFGFCRLS